MTSNSEFVPNDKNRQKILNRIREQNVPNSQLFQEFLVEYELLAEYRLLQVRFRFSIFVYMGVFFIFWSKNVGSLYLDLLTLQ